MAWTSWIAKSRPGWELPLRDLAAGIRLWRQRARSRRQLLRLNEYQLRDIGIDRHTAEEEARKPFWR